MRLNHLLDHTRSSSFLQVPPRSRAPVIHCLRFPFSLSLGTSEFTHREPPLFPPGIDGVLPFAIVVPDFSIELEESPVWQIPFALLTAVENSSLCPFSSRPSSLASLLKYMLLPLPPCQARGPDSDFTITADIRDRIAGLHNPPNFPSSWIPLRGK